MCTGIQIEMRHTVYALEIVMDLGEKKDLAYVLVRLDSETGSEAIRDKTGERGRIDLSMVGNF